LELLPKCDILIADLTLCSCRSGISKKKTAALYDALTEDATYSTTAPSVHPV
jgi:hypothetical protein